MSAESKALVRSLFEDGDRMEMLNRDLVTPGFSAHIAGNPPMNADAFDQFLIMFYNAFSDFTHTFDDMVAEGDRVGFRILARARHTGEFMGTPATGTQVEIVHIGMARIEDGKIAEVWNSPDQLGLMQQLGIIPPPQSAPRERTATEG